MSPLAPRQTAPHRSPTRRARVAAALLGAAVALGIAAPAPARAQVQVCDASTLFTLDWDRYNTQTIGKTGTYTDALTNAQGRSVTATLSFTGDLDDVGGVVFDGTTVTQTPYIGVINQGDIGAQKTLTIGATFDARVNAMPAANTAPGAASNIAGVRLGLSEPVRDVNLKLLDIDYTQGQFRDWIRVTGVGLSGAVVPGVITPFGASSATGGGRIAPGYTFIGPATFNGFAVAAGDAIGTTSNSSDTQNLGNIEVTFGAPVTQINIYYANGPSSITGGGISQQAFSIHDIAFCTMPDITMTKASAQVATTGPQRFAVPGALVDYTLTITNRGGSRVDLNTVDLTDPLPANVTYVHADVDPAVAGTQTFAFDPGTSGLTLTPADVTYAAAGTGPWTLTPAAGDNPAVRAIRFRPQGMMAAGSTATVRFRVRIN